MATARLGRREKRILQATLKISRQYDGLAARSHIYKALDAQLKKEKKQCRKSILRLVKRGLIRIAATNRRGTPLWFQLTETGMEIAENLEKERARLKDLKETLRLLQAGKPSRTATINLIREMLWQTSRSFNSREEFEKYWTKRRLGLILKRMGLKQIWVGKNRKYIINATSVASNPPRHLSLKEITTDNAKTGRRDGSFT